MEEGSREEILWLLSSPPSNDVQMSHRPAPMEARKPENQSGIMCLGQLPEPRADKRKERRSWESGEGEV